MTDRFECVSATVNGSPRVNAPGDEIVLSLYGPKGGTRAVESMSVADAQKLHARLGECLAKLDAPPTSDSDKLQKALALLRSVHSDITAMRTPDTDDGFGSFTGEVNPDDYSVEIEWPNLAIMGREIGEFLKTEGTS